MQILTLENKTFYLNDLPEEVDEDLRFSVLDNSDNQNPDYFFIPLIFLESFTGPAAVLKIGPYDLTMPLLKFHYDFIISSNAFLRNLLTHLI